VSSEAKREAIVRAATELFRRYGFRKTSVDQIAREAQVAKPTVYAYFADKDAVFVAVCRAVMDRIVEGARQARATSRVLLWVGDARTAIMRHDAETGIPQPCHNRDLIDGHGALSGHGTLQGMVGEFRGGRVLNEPLQGLEDGTLLGGGNRRSAATKRRAYLRRRPSMTDSSRIPDVGLAGADSGALRYRVCRLDDRCIDDSGTVRGSWPGA
jgi:AcrR family transcriptional regulator